MHSNAKWHHFLVHDHKETAAFAPDILMKFDADEKLGVFRIVRSIGEGGMGEVFEGARDDGQFEQRVAIKTLHHAVRGSDRVRRFLHERQIMAGLNHLNIARLLDGGVSESGQPYIVMEYIEGLSITEYADARRLTVRQRGQVIPATLRCSSLLSSTLNNSSRS